MYLHLDIEERSLRLDNLDNGVVRDNAVFLALDLDEYLGGLRRTHTHIGFMLNPEVESHVSRLECNA